MWLDWRKPKRFASKPDQYSHALRALALRECKIHIAGKPELHLKPHPVYLDVEGIPDRDFYYLLTSCKKIARLPGNLCYDNNLPPQTLVFRFLARRRSD
jgi:hypothetical protein